VKGERKKEKVRYSIFQKNGISEMNRKRNVISSVSEKSRETNRFLTSFGMTEKPLTINH